MNMHQFNKHFISFLFLVCGVVGFSICTERASGSGDFGGSHLMDVAGLAIMMQQMQQNAALAQPAAQPAVVAPRPDPYETLHSFVAASPEGETLEAMQSRICRDGAREVGLARLMNRLIGQYRSTSDADLTPSGFAQWLEVKISEREQSRASGVAGAVGESFPSDMKKISSSSDTSIYGQAALYGFMGKNNSWFYGQQNMKPTSFMQGMGAGALYRLMAITGDELEEVVRREIAPACDSVVGGLIRSVKNGVRSAKCWLFNGGVRPYTLEQIGYWRTEVEKVILGKLAESATRAQKTQSDGAFGGRPRGQHTFDPLSMGNRQEGAEEPVTDATWMAMVDGLARDLNRITIGLEGPKLHYCGGDDKDDEAMQADGRADLLAMAQGIQDLLQLIKVHILLPSRSLKDLAVGDLKSILPNLKEMVDARFALFESMVSSYHGVTVKASKAVDVKRAKPARHDNAAYNDFAL